MKISPIKNTKENVNSILQIKKLSRFLCLSSLKNGNCGSNLFNRFSGKRNIFIIKVFLHAYKANYFIHTDS